MVQTVLNFSSAAVPFHSISVYSFSLLSLISLYVAIFPCYFATFLSFLSFVFFSFFLSFFLFFFFLSLFLSFFLLFFFFLTVFLSFFLPSFLPSFWCLPITTKGRVSIWAFKCLAADYLQSRIFLIFFFVLSYLIPILNHFLMLNSSPFFLIIYSSTYSFIRFWQTLSSMEWN